MYFPIKITENMVQLPIIMSLSLKISVAQLNKKWIISNIMEE